MFALSASLQNQTQTNTWEDIVEQLVTMDNSFNYTYVIILFGQHCEEKNMNSQMCTQVYVHHNEYVPSLGC